MEVREDRYTWDMVNLSPHALMAPGSTLVPPKAAILHDATVKGSLGEQRGRSQMLLKSKSLRIVVSLADASQRSHFVWLVRKHVSPSYPGTEAGYAAHLFDQHLVASPTSAHERRIVWVARNRIEAVAYVVASHRLDGSVKLGPLVSDSEYIGTGAAAELLVEVASRYESMGTSFLYGTFPSANRRIADLLRACGWEISGAIAGLYRDDEEYLAAKWLNHHHAQPLTVVGPEQRWKVRRKRGGSVLLVPPPNVEYPEVDDLARVLARKAADPRRIAFARLRSLTPNSDQEHVRLVDGSSIVVWRP